jgi:hypothetical protein
MGTPGARAEGPDALQACWRSQQVRVFLRDGKYWDQNPDCVSEVGADRYRSRCATANGRTEIVSSWERVAPDRLRLQTLDASNGASKGSPSELRYRVDGEWLLIERDVVQPGGAGGGNSQPMRIQSVSRRVPAAAGACAPRGDSGLRVGRTPRSSLVMELPSGWKAVLADPTLDPVLGSTVASNFLVGLFARDPPATNDPTRFVLVLDDVRPGPVPVREKEFAAVRKTFRSELPRGNILCDEPDRICGMMLSRDDALVYTELVNVAGRVATVHAAGKGLSALSALQRSAAVFVAQLRAGAGK